MDREIVFVRCFPRNGLLGTTFCSYSSNLSDRRRYMARRLMKALEDLSLQYDWTVRNSEGAGTFCWCNRKIQGPRMMFLYFSCSGAVCIRR